MSEQAVVTGRVVDGVTLPAVGTYDLDVAHTHVGFVVRHMAVSKVRGRFAGVDGVVEIGDDLADSSVRVTIDADSIDTRDENRDAHLRSNDFFDTATHPTWTYTSTAVRPTGPGAAAVDGDLTIRGITRPVTLAVTLEGVVQDPYGNHRVGFSATAEIDRQDFGVSFGGVMEAGGLVVANTVKIEIEAEAVLRQ
ncbi:MAG: YceI family protein [Actinomycetota bacterium]|nr:YceI family protein [Actinomycetota bacterium]